MTSLPLIVGFGGINSAGRSSGFQSYKRMICDALPEQEMISVWHDLAWRMNIAVDAIPTPAQIAQIKAGTQIRKIDNFDPAQIARYQAAKLDPSSLSFVCNETTLPDPVPSTWQVEKLDGNEVKVTVPSNMDILIPSKARLPVSSGSALPAGFDPGALYNSHHHPRGLKLGVYGASDAINSLGMDWDEILQHIRPDEVSVYASSALGQIDEDSLGGVFSRFTMGNRISSKMMALSLAEMPADFINSYIINSVGTTGAMLGACATYLYNLRQGMMDIQSGNAKVVIVGCSEAPLVPAVIEGFNAMGALVTDEQLRALDNAAQPDHRRACRPFSTNAGFTMGESSQFVVLMQDELALKLGANIYGSVAGVFINADANKKSIAKPGVGNYITMAKATALAKAILGQTGLEKTYVSAHGTGTPQNRTTESYILNEVAKAFSINQWPVTAIKSYVGHSISAAAGDQLNAALGAWHHNWIPGIKTIDHFAEDVERSNLHILTDHLDIAKAQIKGTFINSKGFGGNNATGLILSPKQSLSMLEQKYGTDAYQTWKEKNQAVKELRDTVDQQTCRGNEKIYYNFGECMIPDTAVNLSSSQIELPKFVNSIPLPTENPYEEYTRK